MTTATADLHPISLTRREAIACGILFDFGKKSLVRELVIELGLEMAIGITYRACEELLDKREILLALKSALPFAPGRNTIYFLVPSWNKDKPAVWLKAIRKIDNQCPVLTVMTPGEGVSNS